MKQSDYEEIKQHIARVLGVDLADLELTAEEVEARRRLQAYRDSLPGRYAEIAAQITAKAHRDGWLPENYRLMLAPTVMSAGESAARTEAAVRERCTCEPGPRSIGEQHDPGCSLQNTGYLA